MFAAGVRASLKPLFHGRYSSYLTRNCEIAAISKRISHERFNDGEWSLNCLRLSGIKLLNRTFHSSPQCYSSEFDVGVKTHRVKLFSSLEDDFSVLGSVKEDGDHSTVVKLLTSMQDPSQKTNGKTKKKKNHDQASDSISKLKLLTKKPERSWRTNGKSKTEAHASSSPATNVADSKSSSSTRDDTSKAQNIILPSSEAKKEPSSKSKSSNHPSSVVVIRIGNLNSETTDSEIHSMCCSIGPLEGLARINEDTVDVLFRAKNQNKAASILAKLNDATVDHSQWTAEIVPEVEEEASIDQMGMRISKCFQEFDKQLLMRRVLVRDLEILMQSVMHLENHPMAREESKALGCSQEAYGSYNN